jgi:hypothetical protein
MILAGVVPLWAQGASFTVAAKGFTPFAIAPGSSAQSQVTVSASGSFSGTVDLSCTVVSTTGSTAGIPACQVTPATVQPAASSSAPAVLTVSGLTSSGGAAAAGTYSVTVTGTQGSSTSSQSQNITVLTSAPGFTITIQTPIEPSSVHAGNGANGTINVNPLPGYSGHVTLACATVTPLVDLSPYCSFTYPGGASYLNVTSGTVQATITINTYGPINTGSVWRTRGFYALWLPLPLLAFIGAGGAIGGRWRRAWTLPGLLMLAALTLLIPACGTNTGNTTTNPLGNTPNNAYTFTITGTDTNGTVASNATGSSGPTVTLTVN